ncbi:MAG: MerR family transcriptional regulator [Verrucomicrobiales bacterium]|nr:MerR family transcriptional regulator [Verrucomicrobiales bacterium]
MSTFTVNEATHSIRAVSRRTGLSPHVIRAWEKRYGVVEPIRSESNRRRYSEGDVERLTLLRAATEFGHSIGLIATLTTKELQDLTAKTRTVATPSRVGALASGEVIERCLAATRNLDQPALEAALRDAGVSLGIQGLLRQVVTPLTERIGNLWQRGELTAAEEHFASAVIRLHLAAAARPYAGHASAPMLVVATPSGQLHELGAVLVAAAAAGHGWRVTYLGTCLPPAEIVGAAHRTQARAVALSLVYPKDDPRLADELRLLRELLSRKVALLAGGRAAGAYRDVLGEVGAHTAADLDDLYAILDSVTAPPGLTQHE